MIFTINASRMAIFSNNKGGDDEWCVVKEVLKVIAMKGEGKLKISRAQ